MNTRTLSLTTSQDTTSTDSSKNPSAAVDDRESANDAHRHLRAIDAQLELRHERLERTLAGTHNQAHQLGRELTDIEGKRKRAKYYESFIYYLIATPIILGVSFLITRWLF